MGRRKKAGCNNLPAELDMGDGPCRLIALEKAAGVPSTAVYDRVAAPDISGAVALP